MLMLGHKNVSHLIGVNVHCQEDQRGVLDTKSSKHWPNHFAWSAPAHRGEASCIN